MLSGGEKFLYPAIVDAKCLKSDVPFFIPNASHAALSGKMEKCVKTPPERALSSRAPKIDLVNSRRRGEKIKPIFIRWVNVKFH